MMGSVRLTKYDNSEFLVCFIIDVERPQEIAEKFKWAHSSSGPLVVVMAEKVDILVVRNHPSIFL